MLTDTRSRKTAAFLLTGVLFFAALTGGFATHAAFTDGQTAAVEFGVASVNSGTAALNSGTAATNTDDTESFGAPDDSGTSPIELDGDDTPAVGSLPVTAAAVGSSLVRGINHH